MSNYIKVHGPHQGAYRPGVDHFGKTLHLRVDDIEEICDVPNGVDRYKKKVTKEKYEKNKDNPDYFINEGSPDTYWQYLPTALITIGHFFSSNSQAHSSENITVKVRAESSEIVAMIDKATIDLAVSKALAIDAAREERDAQKKK